MNGIETGDFLMLIEIAGGKGQLDDAIDLSYQLVKLIFETIAN
jgi:hypothetical protein